MRAQTEPFQHLYRHAFMLDHKKDGAYPENYHLHPGYELIWVVSGDAWFMMEDQVIQISSGSVLLFRGGTYHKLKKLGRGCYERKIIHFLPEFIPGGEGVFREELDQLTAHCHHVRLSKQESAECQRMFNALQNEQQAVPRWGGKMAMQVYLMELLLFIGRKEHMGNEGAQPWQHAPGGITLSRILEHLNAVWNSPCQLDDIAEALHMSKYYLCHFFKKEMGISIQHYLMERRIHEAAQLLVLKDMTVKEIGFEVGFQTSSHFGRKFKETLGVTPEQYRLNFLSK
ncbi:hypothetical protein SY83_03030 [Paenibacillus swuensis]|uniref:HTH araC/xylS-type domain-containing protein n=1 Tax=Paenibacillus swuensis TaxID=1178515 RepID=A0A172TFA6_9BACL|nr:helix-turn-helix domain-containing protein [Paenibacillus swuensis]ANE45463.1 hypothetical protein SY83_03030 [Paenibacillus swuensis]